MTASMISLPIRGLRRLALLSAIIAVAACSPASNQGEPDSPTPAETGWVGAWAAAPYGPFPLGPLTGTAPVDPLAVTALSLFPANEAVDQSLRMIVVPTLGGTRLRLRFSNLVGDRPLRLTSIQIARSLGGAAVQPGSAVALRFAGADEVLIAPGSERISDAADFAFAAGDRLAISYHVVGASGPMTWHAVSFSLNYVGLREAGDIAGESSGVGFAAQPTVGWFFISGLDVFDPASPGSIVAIGDSITDGAYEVPESNTRWPDLFAQRLRAAGIDMGVLNQGINSNTVTRAGSPPGDEYRGPPAVARFERDVLGRAGVRGVVIFEGTNDLTAGVRAVEVLAGLRSLVDRAHAAGLCVVVGTIPPRDDLIFGWDRATMESERQAINAALRAGFGVEGLADFDVALRSPLDASRPNPLLFSPDLLHPTSIGFLAMADAVPLRALVPPPAGDCTPGGG